MSGRLRTARDRPRDRIARTLQARVERGRKPGGRAGGRDSRGEVKRLNIMRNGEVHSKECNRGGGSTRVSPTPIGRWPVGRANVSIDALNRAVKPRIFARAGPWARVKTLSWPFLIHRSRQALSTTRTGRASLREIQRTDKRQMAQNRQAGRQAPHRARAQKQRPPPCACSARAPSHA